MLLNKFMPFVLGREDPPNDGCGNEENEIDELKSRIKHDLRTLTINNYPKRA